MQHHSVEQLDRYWMAHALSLAVRSQETSPNPMVGAVIIGRDQTIIGEAWHIRAGESHAEIHAITSVERQESLRGATLYVTLEPCHHEGRTPPCTSTIIKSGISRVVVCCSDPNPLVSGRGIAALREAGITVDVGVEEAQGRWINRRFICFHEKRRPYIVLKWAKTIDGFIARLDGSSRWISGEESRRRVHQWRVEEDAILVGTNAAVVDNPALTARLVTGRNPLRVILDRTGRVPLTHQVFDGAAPTLVIGTPRPGLSPELFVDLPPDQDPLRTALEVLHNRSALSVLIEGGSAVLNSCLTAGLWDEARVFIGGQSFGSGVPAPHITAAASAREELVGDDTLKIWYHRAGEFFPVTSPNRVTERS